VLDPVLRLYFERKATPEQIIGEGSDPALVYEVLNKVESPANEFKRRQLPPTLIISRNAIGVGRRRPVTHRYRRQPPAKTEAAAEVAGAEKVLPEGRAAEPV
jgi:NAD+ synthase (glutamine-hydrolysing)